jgi:hypothetical protein
MDGEILSINELRLRVPGFSAEQGRSLGDEVAHRIADGLPEQIRPRKLGALDLRVMVPTGTERDRVASLIAEAILGRLT